MIQLNTFPRVKYSPNFIILFLSKESKHSLKKSLDHDYVNILIFSLNNININTLSRTHFRAEIFTEYNSLSYVKSQWSLSE